MLDEKNLEVLKKFMSNNQQTPDPDDALLQETKVENVPLQQFYQLPQLGDIVTFGCWPFSEIGESKPVEWISLRVFEKDQIAFLISKNCIDCQPCDKSQEIGSGLMTWGIDSAPPYSYRWSNSSLLSWLKNEFYEKCFSREEKARILSQTINEGNERISTPVNLLSAAQVLTLLPRPYERQAKGTPYCLKGAGTTDDGFMPWWLSDTTEFYTHAAAVYADGSVCVKTSDESYWCDQNSGRSPKLKRPICHGFVVNTAIGIRPVIRVNYDNTEV